MTVNESYLAYTSRLAEDANTRDRAVMSDLLTTAQVIHMTYFDTLTDAGVSQVRQWQMALNGGLRALDARADAAPVNEFAFRTILMALNDIEEPQMPAGMDPDYWQPGALILESLRAFVTNWPASVRDDN